MDEENIVRRMINGDMDAFGELMEKYERPALRAAWLISGNAADSEDIVQETFTACYLNRKKLRDPAAFKTWFYRILTRSAWKISRKSRKEQPEEEPASGQADRHRTRMGFLFCGCRYSFQRSFRLSRISQPVFPCPQSSGLLILSRT